MLQSMGSQRVGYWKTTFSKTEKKNNEEREIVLYIPCWWWCSVTKLCPTLCDPVDCSTPGSCVLCYLLEFAQTHVHWVGDTIQPPHTLLPHFFLPSIFPSIRIFSNESALRIRWPKYCSFRIHPSNEYSGLISFRIDWFDFLAVQGTLKSFL